MKRDQKRLLKLCLYLIVFGLVGCDDFFNVERQNLLLTSVETASELVISSNSLTITGEIINENREEPIIQMGHVVGTSTEPILNADLSTSFFPSDTSKTFISTIDSLESETSYYVRAYLISGGKITYGKVLNFVTSDQSRPPFPLSTRSVTNISTNSAIAEGDLPEPPAGIVDQGHVWSSNFNDIDNLSGKNNNGLLLVSGDKVGENGIYRTKMTDLTEDTDYWLKAYVTVTDANNNQITYYSFNAVKIKTAAE